MKIVTWNIRNSTKTSAVWKYLSDKLNPDIALLQEVRGIPVFIDEIFDKKLQIIKGKTGKPQKFCSVMLVKKGMIVKDLSLSSKNAWVNQMLEELYKSCFIGCIVRLPNQKLIKVVSIYNPPYPIPKERWKMEDVSQIKLTFNPDIWGSEIIWSTLKDMVSRNESWVVGGDYNTSEKFDIEWQKEHNVKTAGIQSRGNKQVLDRMRALGFQECLRDYNKGEIIPTYKDTRGNFIHQIDHLFVTSDLYSKIQLCKIGRQSDIFEKSLTDGKALSDHLPIIADFKDEP